VSALRVLLVDDEPLARAGLGALLREIADVEIAGESATGAAAVAAVRALAPDVVFLDVGLPDADGFVVASQLRRAAASAPVLVFVTAHADRALRAFEVQALDYVTKPLRRDRVREAVERARERVRVDRLARTASSASETIAEPPALPRLALKIDGRVHLIDHAAIDWVEADDDHVVVHARGRGWRARETLAAVERRLDPTRFARIHRSTIVALERVRELQPWFNGDWVVILHDGAKLRLSRSHREQVAAKLGRALG
jgi:two-component system LytT family response regulator